MAGEEIEEEVEGGEELADVAGEGAEDRACSVREISYHDGELQ